MTSQALTGAIRNSSMTPARALADERQGDQRHGQVLEDQRQHRRPEVRRGRVARTGRCWSPRPRSARRRPRAGWPAALGRAGQRVALASSTAARRMIVSVDRVRQVRREEPGVVGTHGSTVLTTTSMTDCLPAWNCASASAGATTTTSALPSARPRLGGRRVLGRPPRCAARRRRGPGRSRRRSAGRLRAGRRRPSRAAADAVVAETEDGHDQERAEDEAEERAGSAHDLDELLADEGQERGWRSAQQARASGGGLVVVGRVPRRRLRARPDRARRASRRPRRTTAAPRGRWRPRHRAPGSPRPRRAWRSPASSTMTRQLPRPVLAGRARTNGRSVEQRAVERRGRLDLDDVAADRLAPQVVGRGQRHAAGHPR